MAFVPTLHHELSSQLKSPEPAITANPFATPARTSPRNSEFADINTSHGLQANVQGTSTPPSEPEQAAPQVFEQVPAPEKSRFRQLSITILIILSNLIQMIVNFAGVAGGRTFNASMNAKPTYATWMAASYGLTQGTFVLMSGRLGDVYGHRKMLLSGGTWLVLCTFISAFCHENFFAFVTMRALSGIGGAAIMPSAVAMITITNPPGRVRNLSLGFFAASGPLGGYFSALFLGAFMEAGHWRWFFIFVAGLGAATFIPLWLLSGKEVRFRQNEKIDWIGAALGTTALILFNFVWNQAPSVGWSTPYEIALLILSLVLLTAFIIWEHKTPHPIIPPSIFAAPSFAVLVLVILLNYMTVGTVIWYQIFWLQDVWHWSTLQFAVGWTPFVIFGTGAACLAAWLIPRLAAQWILALGTGTILVSTVLMATIKEGQSYWAQVFPSVVLFSFCPDLVYAAGQIIASNTVRRHQQGIAGSIIGTLNLYGNSLGLGFASTVEVQVAARTGDGIAGFRAALWFGVAISAVALVLDVAFVRRVKDEREGWEEEDNEGIELDGAQQVQVQGATTGAQVSRLEDGGGGVVQRVD
ncbi:major facilitator superfamily domain-containing protein [Aspergillus karnatakaensis]|uniref:major facilitator superfamily domain-containing protein n=1 Tax=Aspergillus karnatakaensis TaxID=1810916 RepID=UPI003CCDA04B